MRNNMTIREELRKRNMSLWELGDLLGKSEATVGRMMRHELPPDEQAHILSVIQREGKNGGD